MKKVFISLFFGLLMTGFANSASAAVLTFDDIQLPQYALNTQVPSNYKDMVWGNFMAYSPIPELVLPPIVSPTMAIFASGYRLNFYETGTPYSAGRKSNFTYKDPYDRNTFALNGFYLSAVQQFDLQINIYGLDNQLQDKSGVYTVNAIPQWFSFNLDNIKQVEFSEVGQPEWGPRYTFAMDNLVINESLSYSPPPPAPSPVPEPSSIILGLMSFGGMFGLKKRKKLSTTSK